MEHLYPNFPVMISNHLILYYAGLNNYHFKLEKTQKIVKIEVIALKKQWTSTNVFEQGKDGVFRFRVHSAYQNTANTWNMYLVLEKEE